ncbi:MAG: multidrug ABC transporter [Butyrivibrio sp.]|nr:multidrug ABC transporter [Butyrivibrio sp.]
MIFYIFLMLLGQIIVSVSQVLLKKSAQKHYDSVIREYLNILVVSGYALLVISMFITIICYKGLPYMGVVLMESVSYIIIMILSRFIFKEQIGFGKICGMSLIILGILIFYLI